MLNFAAEILKCCSIIYRARFLSRLVALLHQLREVSTGKGSARKEVKVAQIDMGNGCMQFGSENILNFAFLVYFGSLKFDHLFPVRLCIKFRLVKNIKFYCVLKTAENLTWQIG